MGWVAAVGAFFGASGAAATIVGAAVVGAAIGGVYAAVTGGNILKGALIGGIAGGLAGWGLSSLSVGAGASTGAGTSVAGDGFGAAVTGAAGQEMSVAPSLLSSGTVAGTTVPQVSQAPGLFAGMTTGEKMILTSGAMQGLGGVAQGYAETEAAKQEQKNLDQLTAERLAGKGQPVATLKVSPLNETWKVTTPITVPKQETTTQPVTSLLKNEDKINA